MKTSIQSIAFSIALFCSLPAAAQTAFAISASSGEGNVFVPISKYIEQGNAERLSAWFADYLEVNLLNKSSECSRNQAKEILSCFFEANRPQRFTLVHKSGDGRQKYAIGTLYCGHNSYTVTIFVNIGKNENHIQMLKIENN